MNHQHARISLLDSLWRELICGDNAAGILLIQPSAQQEVEASLRSQGSCSVPSLALLFKELEEFWQWWGKAVACQSPLGTAGVVPSSVAAPPMLTLTLVLEEGPAVPGLCPSCTGTSWGQLQTSAGVAA